jgi:hypothetical protein
VGALHRKTNIVGRFVAVAAVTVTVGSTLALAGATHAAAASADYQFLSDVNSSRASHGLHALAMVGDLHSVATSWSQHMAGQENISHNPSLTSQGGNWQELGENVGVGPSESSIEAAFMNSPEHRANILDPNYTEIGIGTAIGKDGRLYVTEDFRKPMGGSSSSSSSSHHSSSSTHHSSTTTHHSSSTAHHNSSTSHSSSTSHATPARPAARPAAPRPVPTLAARLRTVAQNASASDPVQQALAFTTTMRALTG